MDQNEFETIKALYDLPCPRQVRLRTKNGIPYEVHTIKSGSKEIGCVLLSALIAIGIRFLFAPIHPHEYNALIVLCYGYAIFVTVLVLAGRWAGWCEERRQQYLAHYGLLTVATVIKHTMNWNSPAVTFSVRYKFQDRSGHTFFGKDESGDGSLNYQIVDTVFPIVYKETHPNVHRRLDDMHYEIVDS